MPDSRTMDIDWASAGLAPNEFTATLWRDILTDAGIEAYLKPIDAATFLIASAILPVRVMVPKHRVEEAKEIIAEVETGDLPPDEPGQDETPPQQQ
jgi:hypothetical protein